MNRNKIFPILILLLGMMLLFATPSLAQVGQVRAGEVFIVPHPAVQGPLLKQPPQLTSAQRFRLEQALDRTHGRIIVPVAPNVRPEDIQPTSPETSPAQVEPLAPGDFRFFQNSALLDTATANSTSVINEPSLGVNENAVFWTGNWYAAVSSDDGQTFSYIDPSTNFPSVNDGFCCNQVVYYEPTRDAAFWLLQYTPDSQTNTQRIAVANSKAKILSNTWFYYDWRPEHFEFPSSGYWLDFPDLAVNNNYLYLTTNVFQISSNTTSTAVIARFPLNEISQGLTVHGQYFVTDRPGLRCTHGATSAQAEAKKGQTCISYRFVSQSACINL
ncbi:hypothetical protein HYR99_12635 [Candidatus Poribacteria bacterium]|nr:hypothetical protein [Candidatus Poribacteria bacterium]